MNRSDFAKRQNDNTKAFRLEYKLAKALPRDAAIPSDGEREKIDLSAPRPWDFGIRPGDVRLLSQLPDFRYVAVLEQQGWDYLVVPFSHYVSPALDSELKLPRDGGLFLETLQVWNARVLHASQLCRSWLVDDRLTEDELAEIREVQDHFLFEQPLPEKIAARTGRPLTDKQDDRREYMLESSRVFAGLDREEREIRASLEILTGAPEVAAVGLSKCCGATAMLPPFAGIVQMITNIAAPITMAAAGTSYRSRVLDLTAFSFREILKEMESGRPDWGKYPVLEAERVEYSDPLCWKVASCPTQTVSVLFVHRTSGKVLGMGVADPKSGRVYLQYENGTAAVETIPAKNIVLVLGK